jgi:hypothetical protein
MTMPTDTPDDGWPLRIKLPEARTLWIRPMTPADADGLIALYDDLDEQDVYRRFFSGRAPPKSFVEKMTHVAERGGFGLIADIKEAGGTSRIVGEATYDLLANGNAELGITVAEKARGWLGPYLLDALVAAAGARGIPNLEADVLVTIPGGAGGGHDGGTSGALTDGAPSRREIGHRPPSDRRHGRGWRDHASRRRAGCRRAAASDRSSARLTLGPPVGGRAWRRPQLGPGNWPNGSGD